MTDPTSFAPMKVPVTNSNVEQCRRVPRWRYADTAFLLGSGGTEVSQPEFTEQFNDGAGVRNMALEPLLALGDLVAAPMGSDRVEDILHGLPQIAVGVVRGAEAASLTLIGGRRRTDDTSVHLSLGAGNGCSAVPGQGGAVPGGGHRRAVDGDEDRTRNVSDAALSSLAGPSDGGRTVAAPRQRSRRPATRRRRRTMGCEDSGGVAFCCGVEVSNGSDWLGSSRSTLGVGRRWRRSRPGVR